MKFYFHLMSLGTVYGMVGLHQYTVPSGIANAPANNEVGGNDTMDLVDKDFDDLN